MPSRPLLRERTRRATRPCARSGTAGAPGSSSLLGPRGSRSGRGVPEGSTTPPGSIARRHDEVRVPPLCAALFGCTAPSDGSLRAGPCTVSESPQKRLAARHPPPVSTLTMSGRSIALRGTEVADVVTTARRPPRTWRCCSPSSTAQQANGSGPRIRSRAGVLHDGDGVRPLDLRCSLHEPRGLAGARFLGDVDSIVKGRTSWIRHRCALVCRYFRGACTTDE